MLTGKFKAGYEGRDSMAEKAKKELGNFQSEGVQKGFPESYSAINRSKDSIYKKGGHVKHGLNKGQTDLHMPKEVKLGPAHQRSALDAAQAKKGGHMHHGKHHSQAHGHKKGKGMNLGGMLQNRVQPGFPGIVTMPKADASMKKGGHKSMNPKSHGDNIKFPKKGEMVRHGNLNPDGKVVKHDSLYGHSGIHMSHGGRHTDHRYATGGRIYEEHMTGEHQSHTPPKFNYESTMMGVSPKASPKSDGHDKNGSCKYAMGGIGKVRHNQASKSGMPMRSRGRSR